MIRRFVDNIVQNSVDGIMDKSIDFVKSQKGKSVLPTKGEMLLNAGISTGIYGAIAAATSDQATDKPYHYAKHGIAAGADIAADMGLTVAANAMMSTGNPYGLVAGIGLHAYNFLGGLVGLDAGSIVTNTFDGAERVFTAASNHGNQGVVLNERTAGALQNQLQSLSRAGSNEAEMMHN